MPARAPDRKRVLFINQFYWPDAAPTAVLLDHLARKFADEGWDATVVCGRTTYADGEQQDRPSVRIVTVPTFPYSRKAAGRMLSWSSFLILASVRCFMKRKFDLVVAMTSPPAIALAGALQKAVRGSDFWIWEMDVYPDIALALKGSPDGIISRAVSAAFRTIRRQADGIVVLGPCMRTRLEAQNLDPAKLHVADNWADGEAIQPSPVPEGFPLNILYSGNLGLAHDVASITAVVSRFCGCGDISFTFAGGGARRAELETFCSSRRVENVSFQGFASKARFLSNLAACHIGLLTLRPECVGTVVPSKMYSFLAAGRPFLFIGPKDSTPALIARQGCGWAFENEDVEGVCGLIEELKSTPARIKEAAAQARLCFERHFSRSIGTARVFDTLTSGKRNTVQARGGVSWFRKAT